MKRSIIRVKLFLLSLLPTLLPTTPKDLETFCSDIIQLGAWPANDSFRHAIATMILHLGPETIRKPKYYFYKAVFSSITKQNAYQLQQDLKRKEKSKDGQQVQEVTRPVVQENS